MLETTIGILLVAVLSIIGLLIWYRHETIIEANATILLQSEHEHFHFHVNMPPNMKIEPGDTLHILTVPELDTGRTEGEISYESPIRLRKASWLQRHLIKSSSLIEVNEIVEHP